MHLRYLRAVLRHKWFVLLAGLGKVPLWQLLKHDWSKFTPAEWGPYARMFYGGDYPSLSDVHGDLRNTISHFKETVQADFDAAWLHHQHANAHHWQHYILREDSGATKLLPMPSHYAAEMLADWRGAGRAYGNNNTAEWYTKNAANIMLHPDTRAWVEREIGVS